ncbi:transmembrane protein 44 [Acanthochromis polyacanthus]|uniref:Transmembrane protein 44 n=1 Tax=Acanthochromis polyacanthus TaxID=80966 RepID=A0A3Q1F0B4_9TELE|nr:transmembrane protein 44 [Acanthochromis polyacanthus]
MDTRASITDGQSSQTFLTGLMSFCVESVTTCFSHDADKLCVPVGLTFASALLLLLSCLLIVCQRCKLGGENTAETVLIVYCFLGDLCSTVGAILSRQLHIQILMSAFASAMDALNCILCCFQVVLCWNSKTERRLRMMKRRRRQHLLAVCVLMVVAGGFLRASQPPAFIPLRQRRLLHVSLQGSSWSPLMDNTELLGYILGLLSFAIACSSRFPALRRACRGQMLTRANIFSGLCCSLAGVLYTAAILLYDTHFGFLMRVLPWLLSSISCVGLDLLIVGTYCCKRQSRQQPVSLSSDMERLLGGSGLHTEDNAVMKRHRKQNIRSSAPTRTKNVQKMAEMGHYMDVHVQPPRAMSLKDVTLSKQQVEDGPLNRMVRVIRAGSFCSTDTSYDSSVVSSDLEWDFEAANTQWREPTAKQHQGDEFPLQEWPTNPKPFDACMRSMSEKTPGEGSPVVTSVK